MRKLVPFTLTLLCLVLILGGLQLSARPVFKNIIIISVDTLRADHLGCYGYPVQTSPVIDTLAKDSILFRHCYTETPLTAPSFSTMFTALPSYKHGAKRNGLSIFKKIKTLPQFLKPFGYKSAAIISNWPLRKKLSGLHKGFDSYEEILNKKRYLGMTNPEGQAPAVTGKAVKWLKKNHNERFLLWVQYTDPHAHYYMHRGFVFNYKNVDPSTYPKGTRMKKIKRYDSEIAFTDFYIGKLIAQLKELNLYDDSLIVFHADHGESFGEHNYFKHGKKLFNSTLHVPLIIKLPGNKRKNTQRQENVSLMDIGKSVFSVLDLPVHPQMEGLSVFEKNENLYWRQLTFNTYGGSVLFKRKSKKFRLKVKPVKYGIISGSTKLIYSPKKKRYEAYRLTDDPFEARNILADKKPLNGLKTELSKRIKAIQEFIKNTRVSRIQNKTISKEDYERLKSLGYIDN
ncbi:MAG: sulfatase [bacterium]|nr:sulfatase [bacterium]